jgi:anti-sigma-K factor RskA
MRYDDPELRDRLAAEYALGTMRGPARRRLERLMREDAGLAELVEDWELRLGLLAAAAPAEEPPARLWDRIADRIGPAPTQPRPRWAVGWWDSLTFWRGFGALAGAAAAALALHVALRPAGPGLDALAALDGRLARIEGRLNAAALAPSHVAVLIDKYRRPMMTAELAVADGRLALNLHIKPPRDFTGKMLEVWMTRPDGTPRSLGLFPSEVGGTTAVLVLTPEIAQSLATGGLQVSLEPSGGSTTGAPSGPVLFAGEVLPVEL